MAKIIEAEQRAGRTPDSRDLRRLGFGLGGVAVLLYVAFAAAGTFSDDVSTREVEGQAVKVGDVRAARCREAGEDSLGDRVWRCDMTLRGSALYENLEGKHITSCFAFGGKDVEGMTEVSCDRVRPENGGKPIGG